MARAKRRRKTYHASMQVTRIEDWCVEAESVEEARALLAQRLGDCVHLEVQDLSD
jgi:hypothetical protein